MYNACEIFYVRARFFMKTIESISKNTHKHSQHAKQWDRWVRAGCIFWIIFTTAAVFLWLIYTNNNRAPYTLHWDSHKQRSEEKNNE